MTRPRLSIDAMICLAIGLGAAHTDLMTVRTTLPIVANGNTIAVHVWFD